MGIFTPRSGVGTFSQTTGGVRTPTGYYQNRPLTYTNDLGQTVVQSGGILVTGKPKKDANGNTVINPKNGTYTPHKAYDAILNKNSRFNILRNKQKMGLRLTNEEIQELMSYTEGLPSVEDLGGNHNARVSTGNGSSGSSSNKLQAMNADDVANFKRLNGAR